MQKYCWIALFIASLSFISYAGVGTLTFSSTTKQYAYGSPSVIDPNLEISNTTAWGGGSIFIQIDTPVGTALNTTDLLDCTLANPSHMTAVFNNTTHGLEITADSSATFADIQSTLRTLTFNANGQNATTRKIHFFVADAGAGYKGFPDFNNKYRVFHCNNVNIVSMASHITLIASTYSPVFGMVGYMANVTSEPLRVWLSTKVLPQSNGGNIFYNIGAIYNNGWTWQYGPEAGTNTYLTAPFTQWQTTSFSNGNQLELDDDINGSNGNVNYQFDTGGGGSSAGGLYEYGGQDNLDLNYITIQTHAPNALFMGNQY